MQECLTIFRQCERVQDAPADLLAKGGGEGGYAGTPKEIKFARHFGTTFFLSGRGSPDRGKFRTEVCPRWKMADDKDGDGKERKGILHPRPATRAEEDGNTMNDQYLAN
eukprot:jgi/Botrbrau1/12796/Bobra.117_1s0015.1